MRGFTRANFAHACLPFAREASDDTHVRTRVYTQRNLQLFVELGRHIRINCLRRPQSLWPRSDGSCFAASICDTNATLYPMSVTRRLFRGANQPVFPHSANRMELNSQYTPEIHFSSTIRIIPVYSKIREGSAFLRGQVLAAHHFRQRSFACTVILQINRVKYRKRSNDSFIYFSEKFVYVLTIEQIRKIVPIMPGRSNTR